MKNIKRRSIAKLGEATEYFARELPCWLDPCKNAGQQSIAKQDKQRNLVNLKTKGEVSQSRTRQTSKRKGVAVLAMTEA